jgi:hypothetical protein
VLAGLAEQKPQLLQPGSERIFRRHCKVVTGVVRVSIGAAIANNLIEVDVPQAASLRLAVLS